MCKTLCWVAWEIKNNLISLLDLFPSTASPPADITQPNGIPVPHSHVSANAYGGPGFLSLSPCTLVENTYCFCVTTTVTHPMICITFQQSRRAQNEKENVPPNQITNPNSPLTTFLGTSSRNLYWQSRIKIFFNKNEISDYTLCTLL